MYGQCKLKKMRNSMRGVWLSLAVVFSCSRVEVLTENTFITTDAGKCCSRLPNSTQPDSSCTTTVLNANAFQQTITTPGYPGPFPADIFCTWEVHAIPGRRIWLDFRNLNLIEKEESGCKFQALVIHSPLTGMSMGPYCGHDGLPNVVSTGNHLRVELQSPYPASDKNYRGFEMVYMETVQTTSPELRPPHWSEGLFMESATNPLEPSTPPQRFKPPRRKNSPPKSPNLKPSPPNRVRSPHATTENYRTLMSLRPYTPPRRYNNYTPKTKENEQSLSPEAIVGIVVGGIILIAAISAVAAKLSLRREDRRRKDDETPNMTIAAARDNPYNQSSLPWVSHAPIYPARGYPKHYPTRKPTGYRNELKKVAYATEVTRDSNKSRKPRHGNNRKIPEPRHEGRSVEYRDKKKPGTVEWKNEKRKVEKRKDEKQSSEKRGRNYTTNNRDKRNGGNTNNNKGKNSSSTNHKSRHLKSERRNDENLGVRKKRETEKR